MFRTFALSTLATLALAASSDAGKVQVNFSGGSGSPLTISLPQAVSFTVTNDTPNNNAIFVFQGVGNFLGGITGAAGSLSYTTNGGSPLAINSAGNTLLGPVTLADLILFKQSNPSVGLNDVLVLSHGSVTTTANITAAAPSSGLYSAYFVDNSGNQLGVGTAVPAPHGDYNADGLVDAADYTVWRDSFGASGAGQPADGSGNNLVDDDDFDVWKTHFGETSGSGGVLLSAAPTSTAIPEPATIVAAIAAAALLIARRRVPLLTR